MNFSYLNYMSSNLFSYEEDEIDNESENYCIWKNENIRNIITLNKLSKKYNEISGLNSNSLSASDNYILSYKYYNSYKHKNSIKNKRINRDKIFMKLFISKDTDFLSKSFNIKSGNIIYENYVYSVLNTENCPFILKYKGYNTDIYYNEMLDFILNTNPKINSEIIKNQFSINTAILLLKLRNFGSELSDGYILKKTNKRILGNKLKYPFEIYQGNKKNDPDNNNKKSIKIFNNTRLSITETQPNYLQIYPEDFSKYSKSELEQEFKTLFQKRMKEDVKFGYIITEYKENTISLHDLLIKLKEDKEDKEDKETLLNLEKIIVQFSVAIHFLIKHQINHNDLHFGNILVEEYDIPKIIRFKTTKDNTEKLKSINFLEFNYITDTFSMKTKYIIKLFDFDYATCPNFQNVFDVPLPKETKQYFHPNKDIISFFITFFQYFDDKCNYSIDLYNWIIYNNLFSIKLKPNVKYNNVFISIFFSIFSIFSIFSCNSDDSEEKTGEEEEEEENILSGLSFYDFFKKIANPLYINWDKIELTDSRNSETENIDYRFSNGNDFLNEIIYKLYNK